ncbi:sushi, von Willebrand factor type A, EGF and pentraxin domain-containing protein 1-like [Rhinoraja longicauda]
MGCGYRAGEIGLWSPRDPHCPPKISVKVGEGKVVEREEEKGAHCGEPPGLVNGKHIGNNYNYRQWVRYRCNEGYELHGSEQALCTDNGWTKAARSCRIMWCDPPPPVDNGTVQPQGECMYGQQAHYSCDRGYTLTEDGTISCTHTGHWSSPAPICTVKRCGHPPPVDNGTLWPQEECTYGQQANYSCDRGHTLTGNGTISCTHTGHWSSPAPNCTVMRCGHPPPVDNGTVWPQEECTYEQQAHYSCDRGYTLTEDGTISCTHTGNWSSPAPNCTVMRCGHPPPVDNGTVWPQEECTYEQQAHYYCDPGYTLTGDGTISCTHTGHWSSPAPICTVMRCGHPPPVDNGTVWPQEECTYRQQAHYSCDRGYTLTEDGTISCTHTGNWSSPAPNCTVMRCGHPPPVDNGTVWPQEECTYEQQAHYYCDPGYTLTGDGTISCTHTGHWSSPAPICTVTRCGHPPPVDNGTVWPQEECTYEQQAHYYCDLGYTLTGDGTISCTHTGHWSSPAPNCTVMRCGHPPPVDNGTVWPQEECTYEQQAHYSCDRGYTLTEDGTISCTHTGNWSSPAPNCTVMRCGHPPPVDNGTVWPQEECTYEQQAHYYCDPGYTLTGDGTISCTHTGHWSSPAPICTVMRCGHPPPVDNGTVWPQEECTYRQQAHYSCDRGYTLTEDGTISCTHTGNWSSPAPNCTVMRCGHPPPVDNGTVWPQEECTYEQQAHYYCDPGYTLTGDGTISCTHTGHWSSPAPICTVMWCGHPPPVDNGTVWPQEECTYKQQAHYYCDLGYTLTGDGTISCTHTGHWSSPAPICTVTRCGHPPPVDNGTVWPQEECTYEQQAHYYCDLGYTLTGDGTISCTHTGHWSSPAPICTVMRCGHPPPVDNGTVWPQEECTYRQQAHYSCDRGYTLTGDGTISCTHTGNWSSPAPNCTVMRCGPPPQVDNGTVWPQGECTYEQQANYSCDPGYTLTGDGTISCTHTGDWSSPAPICTEIDVEQSAHQTSTTAASGGGVPWSVTISIVGAGFLALLGIFGGGYYYHQKQGSYDVGKGGSLDAAEPMISEPSRVSGSSEGCPSPLLTKQ